MTRSNHKLFTVIFLCIYCSIALIYDFRILEARGLISGFALRTFFTIWAPLLLPFIAYLLIKIPLDRRLISFYSIYVLYILLSLVVGILSGNDLIYLAGDFYKSLFIPAGISLFYLTQSWTTEFYKLAAKILIVYAILRLIIFLSSGMSLNRIYYGTVYDTLMVGMGFIYIAASRNMNSIGKNRNQILYGILPIVLSMLGQKKLVYVSLLGLLVARARSIPFFIFGLFSLIFISLFLQQILSFVEETRLGVLLNFQQLALTEAQRLEEIRTIFELWTSNLSHFFFGKGFGTTIPVYSVKEGFFIDLHSIHNATMATALRSGLFGVFIIILITSKSIKPLFFDENLKYIAGTLLAVCIASQFAYSFMDEMFVGYLFAQLQLTKTRAL